MNTEARVLFNTIHAQMPTRAAKQRFKAAMHNHTEGHGNPRPQQTQTMSASSLSRYYNLDAWNVKTVIAAMQSVILNLILITYKQRKGRAQILNVNVNLTTLEKTGDFPAVPVSVFNNLKGLHLIVLYVCIGPHRYPFCWAIWKGKGCATLSDLTIALLKKLQRALPNGFKLRLLGDTAFGTTQVLEACVKLKVHAVLGMTCDRLTSTGRPIQQLAMRGTMVFLHQCQVPVWVSWFKLKLSNGQFEWRYVVSTKAAEGITIIRWGRARWVIEAFFKCMKGRFGLAQFGQRTLLGVTRFITLCFLAFVLTACSRLDVRTMPDWAALAKALQLELLPFLCFMVAQRDLERARAVLERGRVHKDASTA
jgi:hypothetical protein